MDDQIASPIRAVIVDDHVSFSRGLQLLFDTCRDKSIRVLATTEQASEAVCLVKKHDAQVALVDIQMPPPGGIEAISQISRQAPECSVIALSGIESTDVVLEALRAGAAGYLLKSAEPEHLIPPIRAVLSDMLVLPSSLRNSVTTGHGASGLTLPDLTAEDVLILRLLAGGGDTAQIAERILTSERTAKRTIASLLKRLGVGTRTEAAVLATHAGLITQT